MTVQERWQRKKSGLFGHSGRNDTHSKRNGKGGGSTDGNEV
jgi:hypothetical protein